jgi:hypothetical protein
VAEVRIQEEMGRPYQDIFVRPQTINFFPKQRDEVATLSYVSYRNNRHISTSTTGQRRNLVHVKSQILRREWSEPTNIGEWCWVVADDQPTTLGGPEAAVDEGGF